jgi:hypothetical protein
MVRGNLDKIEIPTSDIGGRPPLTCKADLLSYVSSDNVIKLRYTCDKSPFSGYEPEFNLEIPITVNTIQLNVIKDALIKRAKERGFF